MMDVATNRKRPRHPSIRSREGWQEAADIAAFWLKVADYYRMGVLKNGPVIDEKRCERIITLAAKRGVHPVE